MAEKKSAAELRTERLTWFALVSIFVIATIIPEDTIIPNAFTPFVAGIVLALSGIYQYMNKWRVHFITWISATLMFVMTGYNILERPDLDLSFVVIMLVALVIANGIFSKET